MLELASAADAHKIVLSTLEGPRLPGPEAS